MKLFTVTLFAAFFLTLAAPLIPAQAQMPAPHGAARQNPETALGLTPAQKAKLTALAQNAQQQILAVNANRSLTPAVRMAKMRAVGQNFTVTMMALLTPAQRAKAKAMMRQQHGQGFR